MRRCLCPGGLLRTGRRILTPLSRSSALSYTKLSRFHAQSISTEDDITSKEIALIHSYNSLPPSPLRPSERGAVDSWIRVLARHVKPAKQGESASDNLEASTSLLGHTTAFDRAHAVKGILYNARNSKGFKLLNHIGFHKKDWSYVYLVLRTLIDTYELLIPHMNPRRMGSSLTWLENGLSLDELAGKNHDKLIIKRQLIPTCPASEKDISLNKITGQRPAVRNFADTFLGETLVNLGSLLLEAADRPAEEAELAMPFIYRALARLHHLDVISDKVYQFSDKFFDQQSIRPPGLHMLSGHIMSVLSDAAWLEHESELASAATEAGEHPPFVPFKVGVRELGPEIWLELILWCCVEHGFNKQGAWLVGQMKQYKDLGSWKIESWEPLLQALDVVQQTSISTERYWRRPGQPSNIKFRGHKKPPFNGLGKKTISSEVVSSLRIGLSNDAYNGIGFHGSSPSNLIKHSAPLTSLLDPPGSDDELRPTSQVATENIIRILESGCLLPMADPISFGEVLRSTRSYVPPWEDSAVPSAEDLDRMTRAQLYDQTAALSGLVEYNVKSYSYNAHALSAFAQYACLQNIVDASKAHHIKAFFEHLNQSESVDVPFFDSQKIDPSQLQHSSLPQVSPTTLADLLDLATISRAHEFGNWLLFNDDFDGPSIPPAAYGSQVLAPSIIRFAAATHNKELAQSVFKSLEMPLSVNTLKAMANLHISSGEWDRAILAFNYLRDYRAKSWGFSNIMTLGAKVVKLENVFERSRSNGAPMEVQDKLKQSLSSATSILRRFFDGEFNTPRSKNRRVTDFQWRVLERARGIFLSVPGQLAEVASRKLTHKFQSRDRIQYVPVTAFHTLFSAIVEVHGFEFGKNFLFRWGQKPGSPNFWRQREGGVVRLQINAERDWTTNDPTYNPKWHKHTMEKAVIPNLSTYRVLTLAALKEYRIEKDIKKRNETTKASDPTQSSSPTSPSSESSASPPSFHPQQVGYRLNVSRAILWHQTIHGGLPPSSPAEANLDLCVSLYLRAGMPEEHVELELRSHMRRLRKRGVLISARAKRPRDRFKNIQNGPWMKTSTIHK